MTDHSRGGPEARPHGPLPGPAADPLQRDSEVRGSAGSGDAPRGHTVCGRERNTTGEGEGEWISHTHTHTHLLSGMYSSVLSLISGGGSA